MARSHERVLQAFLYTVNLIKRFAFLCFPSYAERCVKEKFLAAGITVNGKEPWDIQVHNPKLYIDIALDPALGLGEGYMDELWTVQDFGAMFFKLFESKRRITKTQKQRWRSKLQSYFKNIRQQLLNLQTETKAWEVAKEHFDIGNDVFEAILDPTMNYTCGYWKNVKTLDEAQIAKMDLIAAKLKLKPGMKVLDIGCGWGGLAKHLATNYKVSVVAATVSKEQVKLGRERCKGLPVEFKLVDYRDLNYQAEFDRVVAIGLMEHVGKKNYNSFLEVARKSMKDDGLFILHTIGLGNTILRRVDSFHDQYIFPNGTLPYHTEVAEYTDGLFVIEDWHNFGYYYSKTLDAWVQNFDSNWHKLKPRYGDRFYRMFTYYLKTCAECFRTRRFQLWQIVLSKNGVEGGYESVR